MTSIPLVGLSCHHPSSCWIYFATDTMLSILLSMIYLMCGIQFNLPYSAKNNEAFDFYSIGSGCPYGLRLCDYAQCVIVVNIFGDIMLPCRTPSSCEHSVI